VGSNSLIPEGLLWNRVSSLAVVGREYFPQVYAVIRDTEENSDIMPIPPMHGLDGMHVGCTIDMSVELGNATHHDIHDMPCVWTRMLVEDITGS
jgi:hypothetical protein